MPETALDALTSRLDVGYAPSRLSFTRASVWSNGIAALEPERVPAALSALHAALGARLAASGFATEARSYRPHVTLARNAWGSVPGPLDAPIELAVDGIALVRSRGGRYRIVARHAFAGSSSTDRVAPR